MTSAVRAKNGLKLTPAEVADVRTRFPKAADDKIYIDAVFEGGGVRGLAFLGALRCLNDAGIRTRKVAGTSAGAITAALAASGMTIDQLEANVWGLDFMKLLTKKTRPGLIFNGTPDNDMDNMALMLANLSLVRAMGQYKTDPLKDWMDYALKGKLEKFGDLKTGKAWHEQKDLRIVISDISAGEMRVLPGDLPMYKQDPSKFSVSEAVRLSMSIPLFFEPGNLGGNTIVDGGILSSFYLAAFDKPPGVVPDCPTIGLKLSQSDQTPVKITTAIGVVGAMIQTMMTAHDRRYTRLHDQHRIIEITSTDVSITHFGMTEAEKEMLYVRGYNETKEFLLNKWSWTRYLEDRCLPLERP